MEKENALNIIYKYILGDESIPIQIRKGEGLDNNSYNLLVDALIFLVEQYKKANDVPKKLALCFVDIGSYFYIDEDFYPEIERIKIEDAGHKISELANRMFEE